MSIFLLQLNNPLLELISNSRFSGLSMFRVFIPAIYSLLTKRRYLIFQQFDL